jgi:hypothetical protein
VHVFESKDFAIEEPGSLQRIEFGFTQVFPNSNLSRRAGSCYPQRPSLQASRERHCGAKSASAVHQAAAGVGSISKPPSLEFPTHRSPCFARDVGPASHKCAKIVNGRFVNPSPENAHAKMPILRGGITNNSL